MLLVSFSAMQYVVTIYNTVNVVLEFYAQHLVKSLTQDFHVKMESLQQRREELERKEQQLKDSLLKFDKFLKVCTVHTYMQVILLVHMYTSVISLKMLMDTVFIKKSCV